MTVESDAVKSVAGLMALVARTAPKAVGPDPIKVEVLTGKDQDKLAIEMIKRGNELKMDFSGLMAGRRRYVMPCS